MIAYTLIRSNRRTLYMEVTKDLTVLVRAPMLCSKGTIDRFVEKHNDWIAAQKEKICCRAQAHPEPTDEEKQALIHRAKKELPERVAHYAAVMNVKPNSITVTGAKKRFGSCSGNNRLCFAWRLMDYPEEAIDYVVVHELAHIVHKNHGREFYALIESVLPDYKQRKKLLER